MDGYHVVTVNHHFLVVRADHAFSGNILITGSRAAHQFERVTISTGELRNEQAGTLFNLVAVIVRQNESNVANAEAVIARSVIGLAGGGLIEGIKSRAIPGLSLN